MDKSLKAPKAYQSSGAVGLSKSSSVFEDGYDYPVFCFRHLHRDYDIDQCVTCGDKNFLKAFAKKLKTVCDLTWMQIKLSDRKGLGTEKIVRSSLRASVPASLTKDVEFFLSFYFAGGKGRIVGYQNNNIFHVVYIDTDLSVYGH